MAEKWYVLRSKPRREAALCGIVRAKRFEIFYPSIPARPINPRASKTKAYFPGYIFLHTDLSSIGPSTFRWMPFSYGLVRIGGEPARVPDPVVSAIRKRIAEIWEAGGLVSNDLQRGDRIVIQEGVFEGYEGIFDERLPGKDRAKILLQMLNDRFVPMEVDLTLLARAKKPQGIRAGS